MYMLYYSVLSLPALADKKLIHELVDIFIYSVCSYIYCISMYCDII